MAILVVVINYLCSHTGLLSLESMVAVLLFHFVEYCNISHIIIVNELWVQHSNGSVVSKWDSRRRPLARLLDLHMK